MWFILLFFSGLAMAQEPDLSGIKNLEERLPDYNRMSTLKSHEIHRVVGDNKYSAPKKIVNWEKIKSSGTAIGTLEAGSHFVRLEDNVAVKNHRPIYVRHYLLEDEEGFKYVINSDGTTTFRVESRFVEPIEGELALYEPPLKYTPAPANRLQHYYDKKLSMSPEAILYVGQVDGDYMRDLANDKEARNGISSQYGVHYFTNWKLPLKFGGALHYEQATYDLTGGRINYSSLSFGPQIKTKNFEIADFIYRFQLQLRVGPWAKAEAEIKNYGSVDIKFNSKDLMGSIEHPMKNQWGEWVLGVFYQAQWLNIRDQSEIVSIKASNRINSSIGLSLAQVFE